MKIAEIFKSIQGEGPFVGRPAIFVRVAICNLNCPFCDQPIKTSDEYTYDEIFEQIKVHSNFYNNDKKIDTIIWTGGEPTLYIFDIAHFIKTFAKNFKHHIETNGTNIIDMTFYNDFEAVVVSPKIDLIYYNQYFEQWNKYLNHANNVYFKFLITDNVQDDIANIDKILDKYPNFTKNPVYLQPLNNDIKIALEIVKYISNPYYLSMQIHKFLAIK